MRLDPPLPSFETFPKDVMLSFQLGFPFSFVNYLNEDLLTPFLF